MDIYDLYLHLCIAQKATDNRNSFEQVAELFESITLLCELSFFSKIEIVSVRGRLPWLGTSGMFSKLLLCAEILLIFADGSAATDHSGDVIKVLYYLAL